MDTVLVLNSTYRFYAPGGIRRNGEVWDLTGAAVFLCFRRPDGSEAEVAASIVSARDGEVEYRCDTSFLGQPDGWSFCWRILQGPIDIKSGPVAALVIRSP